MEVKSVRRQASHLIMQNKLQMSFDLKNDLLVVSASGTDIKEIQQLSLQYVAQIQTMVTQNENMANLLTTIDPLQ